MSPAVSCPERDQHLKHYHDAVRAYRIAVISLEPDLPPNKFEVAYKRAEEARTLFEDARQQLKDHLDAHGCDPNQSKTGNSSAGCGDRWRGIFKDRAGLGSELTVYMGLAIALPAIVLFRGKLP
jgi:hypothetical protein